METLTSDKTLDIKTIYMKRIIFSSLGILTLFLFSGCIKNTLTTYKDAAQIEWDAASWNANSAGVTYPIFTRVPIFNAANPTSQPTITRASGTIQLRVNLIGPQSNTDGTFTYTVSQSETTAVAGTHYTALSGTGVIPANSSFGYVNVAILNPGPGTGTVDLVLQLTSNSTYTAAVNYAKVGLRIAQN